ncbi:hypothetical protein GCM10025771_03070 [Niveibacterium umoris]
MIGLAVMSVSAFAESEEPKGPSPAMQEKIRKANEECFSCHSAEGVKNPPKPGMDLKKLRTLIRDKEAFHGSDHQRLACTKCHNEGYDEHPHAPDAKDNTSSCPDCHQKKADHAQEQFDKSVHAKNLAEKFTCTTCHNPHVMRIAKKLVDPKKIVAQDNRICLGCHDSDERFAQFAPDGKSRPAIDDIHAWLPNARIHWKAVRCVECHTPEVAADEPISHEILDKKRAEKRCVTCHSRDSALMVRLYRHLAEEDQKKYGFVNGIVLSNNYVIGSTRNPLVDTLMVGLAVLTLGGVLIHAALRVLMHYLRRSNNK